MVVVFWTQLSIDDTQQSEVLAPEKNPATPNRWPAVRGCYTAGLISEGTRIYLVVKLYGVSSIQKPLLYSGKGSI